MSMVDTSYSTNMTDERITAYLLQELTEDEAERFEEECFAHEKWPAELESVEADLIDAYLQERLTPDQRRRFEENYLTTVARKERVLVAQSFLRVVCPAERLKDTPRKVTFGQSLKAFWQRPLVPQFAVGIFVLVIGVALFVPMLQRALAPQTSTRLDLAMSLGDRAQGVQPKKVSLPLSTAVLKIYLKIPEPLPNAVSYRVQWENINGSLDDLKIEEQAAQSVMVEIPAAKLTQGRYTLKLSWTDRNNNEQRIDGNYYFTAE